jgi:hypothetical protein
VAPSKSYQACSKYFVYYRIINRYSQLVVCYDNANLKLGALVRSDETYVPFMHRVEKVSKVKRSDEDMDRQLFNLFEDYRSDPVAVSILTRIAKYRPELTGYRRISSSPVTTNMMEGLNSHLEARLTALRSFQSPHYAKLWLNGYVLKRRITKFTDCRGKFRPLNGKKGVDLTKKPGIDLPSLF